MPTTIQTILIVEDSDDDYEATIRALKKANLRNPVERASNGQEAIDMVNEQKIKPGLVLLDLNLPGMDGRKVLEYFKSTQMLRKIPIVVLTTSNDRRDVEACYQLGANTYVQKPVDLDGLFSAIQRLTEYWFEIALLPKEA